MRKTLLSSCLLVGTASALVTYWLVSEKWVPVSSKARLPNAMVYTGNIVEGVFEGSGELTGAGNTRYVGTFVSGVLDGEGEYWDEAGNHFQGTFVEGVRTGKGVISYIDGTVYKGDFVAGEFNGRGELKYLHGERYQGEFERSTFNGYGKYLQTEEIWFEGEFVDGFIVSGKSVSPYGSYEGKFHNWLFHGEGVYVRDDGAQFEGQFSEGSFAGRGSIKDYDGSFYEGEVADWTPHGLGVKTEANGNVYEGSFEFGLYHGEGELKLAEEQNGVKALKGNWEWGVLNDDPRFTNQLDDYNVESLLYSQERLIELAVANVKGSDKGSPELFTVGVAGYGMQDVFLKEIQAIESILDRPQYSENRGVYLINHYQTADSHPLATATSLSKVLHAVGQRMDMEEDILFLYLTSHGSKSHELSVRLGGISLPNITPQNIADAIENSGIRWRVVIISACYSGGFMPALQSDDALIITAARADRKSFGCDDEREMTYFGEAFFKHALPLASSFEEVFRIASDKISGWESERHPDDEHSEPQISIGKNIVDQLALWRKSHEYSPASPTN